MKFIIFCAILLGPAGFLAKKYLSTQVVETIETKKSLPKKFAMKIEGMTCGHCAKGITAELKRAFHAEEVEIEVETGDVSFVAASEANKKAVKDSIESLGYKVLSLQTQI